MRKLGKLADEEKDSSYKIKRITENNQEFQTLIKKFLRTKRATGKIFFPKFLIFSLR